jgi:soluble lytic murein transglycosylase
MLSNVLRELEKDGATEGTRASALRKVNVPASTWTEARLFTRAHHFVAKTFYKASTSLGSTETERHARQLAFPIGWPEFLWPASQERDLDPLLVLALIRKESLYRSDAVSSAGAVGLMQVMPTTGALVAARLNEPTFSPRLLADPETSIRLGTAYLSWLSERFEGVLPLMIGSYNAGPYAVSTWLNGTNDSEVTIELDDWVEQIPYRETRRYVKSVLGAYGAYVAAYHPNESVDIDLTPKGDDASAVDF